MHLVAAYPLPPDYWREGAAAQGGPPYAFPAPPAVPSAQAVSSFGQAIVVRRCCCCRLRMLTQGARA